MQYDKVVEQDTAAALEGLHLTANAGPSMPRAMSSDLECLQDQELDDWQEPDIETAEQPGTLCLVLASLQGSHTDAQYHNVAMTLHACMCF